MINPDARVLAVSRAALVAMIDGWRSHTRGKFRIVPGALAETELTEEEDVVLTERDAVSPLLL